MSELKAFVGHSFEKSDEAVVSAFLEYFDQIKKIRPDFTWEHAKSAAPKDLAAKVLELIADKNVFIGICTRRERTVPPEVLSPSLWPRGFWKARASDFQWKTSDWILQEIGLARGREMQIIILLEEGVRELGGLEGNVEYIVFNRHSPQNSFGPLLEMVHAITPRVIQAVGGVSENPGKSAPEIVKSPPDDSEYAHPLPSWTPSDYRIALFRAVRSESEEQLNLISTAYFATSEGASETARAEWNANVESTKMILGKGGSVQVLSELANAHPDSSAIAAQLAHAYARYSDYERAAEEYSRAATIPSATDSYWLRGTAAIQLAKAGKAKDAHEVIEAMKADLVHDSSKEKPLLDILTELAQTEKDNSAEVAAMERIVAISPDDIATRFQLAFKHSERGNEIMALHHYLAIPQLERGQSVWNNLGVSFDHFELPGKSVAAYRTAEKMGETLAMSNLANQFLGAGFLDEADVELKKALEHKDYHQNVPQGMATLKAIPDQEEKKLTEVLETARPKIEFFRRVGRALVRPRIVELQPGWSGPDCDLVVSIIANKFKATGTYDVGPNALALALNPSGLRVTTKYTVEYEGTISGSLIEGTVKHDKIGDPPRSLLSSWDNEKKLLMVLDEGTRELHVMEDPEQSKPRFYSIRAQ